MIEKSGAAMNDVLPGTPGACICMVVRCWRDITRRWMVEHLECASGNAQLSYPGKVAMP